VIQTAGTVTLLDEFRDIFDAEFEYVWRALRRLGVREADVADVTQELFVSVHRALESADRKQPIRPWLYAFAVRYASNYRRLARVRGHDSIDELSDPPSSDGVDHASRDLLLRALSVLDFDRRTVLVMHDFEGFKAPEIAETTGAPLNTVYSRLRLAREDFRAAVEKLQTKGGSS